MLPPIFGVIFDGIAYGMLGGYISALLVNDYHWPFLATLPVAFIVTAVVSVFFERVFYRRLYRSSDLDQALLTIGLAFIAVAAAAYVFGTVQQPIQTPALL